MKLHGVFLPLAIVTGLSSVGFAQSAVQPYLRSSVPLEERISDLLTRMTLQEKVAQLQCVMKDVEKDNLIGPEGLGGIGPILRSLDEPEAAAKANRIHRLVQAKSRLKIPPILHDEGLHGVVARGATSFPQAIGLAATWDPELLERVAAAIGRESRARGIRQLLSPVINIARDVRWGRVEETYGEDPYLTSRMGVAFCRGVEQQAVVTTPKHYAANVGDGGRDSYPVHFSERLLREVYFPAFEACIREAGAQSVMASYNSLDGLPASAHPWLLTTVLRKEWGFSGFVVSDYGSAAGIMNMHHVASNEKEAAALGINAGLDVELPDVYIYGQPLLEAVRENLVSGPTLDEAVRRVLRVKFRLGLFDDPMTPERSERLDTSAAHRSLALQAARQSIVLLKNEKQTLPLRKDLRSLAVIGPAADAPRLGGYSGSGQNVVTMLQGITRALGGVKRVQYSKGCELGFASLPSIPAENLRPTGGKPGQRGLRGEYFANATLSGPPALTRVDERVHCEWQMGSPDSSIPVERFSARWTGKLVPTESGKYRLGASTDDGLRLSLDGKLLIDSWYDRGASLDFVNVELVAGREYDLVMEYYENVGWAYASLVWQRDVGTDPRIAEAVALAKKSDAAVIVAGIQEGEGYDRSSLDLPGDQETLIREVAKTGTPTIVVLMAGSAVTVRHWADGVKAIVDVWYPGQEGGTALAEVLFGDINPGGRLPITFPQSVGQVPLYYGHKPTGRGNDYVEMSGKPQFPFGFGLSYTQFEYTNLTLTPERLTAGGSVRVSMDLRNSGSREGDEVVQLYLHDPVASVVRPVKELKAFRRVTLAPGERQTIVFTLDSAAFSLLDRDLKPVIEPGAVEILVGASSEEIRLKGTLTVVK